MPRAFVVIREAPWYRRQAFAVGLKAAGYDVLLRAPDRGRPGDLLVGWNRYSHTHALASRFESEGGLYICAENGYLGAGGTSPKFDVHPRGPQAGSYYAVSKGFHNDHTRVHTGGPERWRKLDIELKPWRTDGGHVLVAPNRPFGAPGRAMPADWAERTAARLRQATRRPVRVRPHPGNDAPRRPLEADLEGAWAVVVWSSSVAVHALAAGIPCYIEAPFQIVKGAGASGPVDNPVMPERLPHFQRMAWGQWTIDEIARGEPFSHLLRTAEQGKVAADS